MKDVKAILPSFTLLRRAMDKEQKRILEEKAEKAIQEQIGPSLESECAAKVVFYEVTDEGKAKVGLRTTCGNCPRAHETIKQSVEVALRVIVPEIRGVEPFFL